MSYGLYQVEEEFRGSTMKVVRIVAFTHEAALKSFAKVQKYDEPVKFSHCEDGTTRTIAQPSKTLLICRLVKEMRE